MLGGAKHSGKGKVHREILEREVSAEQMFVLIIRCDQREPAKANTSVMHVHTHRHTHTHIHTHTHTEA